MTLCEGTETWLVYSVRRNVRTVAIRFEVGIEFLNYFLITYMSDLVRARFVVIHNGQSQSKSKHQNRRYSSPTAVGFPMEIIKIGLGPTSCCLC